MLQPEKGTKQKRSEPTRSLSIEQVLGNILKEPRTAKANWTKKGLPKLIREIEGSYAKHRDITHVDGKDLPSKKIVITVLEDLLTLLLPGYLGQMTIEERGVEQFLHSRLTAIHDRLGGEIEKSLKWLCRRTIKCPEDFCHSKALEIAEELLTKIPEIRALLKDDIQAAYDGDPAAKSIDEVILSYPCILAIATYRLAHVLYERGVPLLPRIMSENAHSITGIDIHPGAKIGRCFFIDHGTGVVIGETAEIGDHVKIYQGVTLGSLSFPKDELGQIVKGLKRHPTIGNNVILYSGATILGGKTTVGDNAVVGGNTWITSSIPADTQVALVPPQLALKGINGKKGLDLEDYVI